MKRTRRTVRIPWRAPLLATHGTPASEADARELTVFELIDERGCAGHGESAPLPRYLGSSVELAERAAIDVAEWDLRARRERVPLWRLLGAAAARPLEVNATVGAEEPAVAAHEAATAVRAGFTVVKIKVGDPDDLERVRAVRDAVGPEVALRVDANGAWEVEQAVARLRELASVGLELCEEPVHGATGIAEVARRLPHLGIAADESSAEMLELDRGRCRAVCLKVARGGISRLLDDAARARSLGYEVYLASTLDGPLGIAAALHTGSVIAPDRPSGLATLDRFARASPIPVSDGTMSPPPGVGLGDGLLEWYER